MKRERGQLFEEISHLFYLEGFGEDDADDNDGSSTLIEMGLVDGQNIDIVLGAIQDLYDIRPTGVTLETTFDQLVDAVLALLE